ncbi:hypothetical protein BH09BAC5_BH09BAC5_10140 [soil metagenome]
MNEVLIETLIDWAATRSDEVVYNPKEGFYSFEIVDDAYRKGIERGIEKGKELGENSLKEAFRQKYFSKAKLVSEVLGKMLNGFSDNSFQPIRLFMSHSIAGSNLLLTIPEDIHHSEKFIAFAYTEALKLQTEYHKEGLNLDIGFIDESSNINLDLLKSDGFEFVYDLVVPEKS